LPDALQLLLAFAIAAGLVQLSLPLAIRLADATGFIDRPVGYKKHGRATPYLGGLGLMAAVLPAALLFGGGTDLLVIIACAAGLCVVGLIDDRMNVGPGKRVLAEFAAAFALWQADIGWLLFDQGVFNLALTVVWVIALVNAFNLMDNLDGAAGTVAGVSAAGIAALAASQGEIALAALSLALCGGCVGFLRFNLSRPARIFLGDGGSMPVGFLLAATVMAVPPTMGFGTASVFAVIPLVGLPVLDTVLVIVSRMRRGANVLSGGRDHLTHRLLNVLGTPQAVALALGATQAVACGVGFVLYDASIAVVFATATAYVLAGAGAIFVLEWQPHLRGETVNGLASPVGQESRP
jgi:UDP-GlcNAc:undecaprenyl-phosphate/decaprenyl-phosphate GlcNAc-1-phosphate transferase